MTPETVKMLDIADQSWSFGLLTKARAGYADVLARSPECWPAAFQLAWIDAAFGPLDPARVSSLQRFQLPIAAAACLDKLVERARLGDGATFLEGGIERWDIGALRAAGAEKDAAWWEKRARLAALAGQDGLAQVCYGEAERLAPEMYFDPPMEWRRLHPSEHVRAIREAA